MATKAATYLAFQSIVKRSLTTTALTPRTIPRPRHLNFHPPHQTLASKATKGRKLPKNHFTSNSPAVEGTQKEKPSKEKKEPKNKRKAAHRPSEATSLRRVAFEAQRSRGTLIKGTGPNRHVDPDVETKDVTAYCAAEQYNLHVARDLLKREGYKPDPFNTELFPQVLHVQTPPSGLRSNKAAELATSTADEAEETGDIFVFPSGSIVVWNVSERLGHHLVERLLRPAAESGSHPERLEVEDLEYIEDGTREHSKIVGDTIILGTKPSTSEDAAEQTGPAASSKEETSSSPETDTTLAKIAFSSALARSTKLAVLENALDTYMHSTRSIPSALATGTHAPSFLLSILPAALSRSTTTTTTTPKLTRAFVLNKTGTLLSLRANLNLYSELTDSLPDIFWDSPHELGLETYYDQISRALDVDIRIKLLNEKMDYAAEIAAVLREQLGEQHGHRLEWIIIWLIVIEVLFGCYHIWKEVREFADPGTVDNLAREWFARELEREKQSREGGGKS